MKRCLPGETANGTGRFRLYHLFLLLAALAAVLWMYWGSFRSYFIQDDYGWLVLSRFQSFGDWAECFIKFNPAGTYRPLSQETFFWVAQKLFGMWAAGFHIIIIGTHIIVTFLLYKLLRWFVDTPAAIAGAFVYAISSAHVISLFWISAFPELLAMVFLLASVLLFIRFDRMGKRGFYILSLLAMVLGIMSKESILTLPLILAAYCLLWSRSRLAYTVPYFALSGIYVFLRIVGQVRWSPYDLSLGKQTLQAFMAYLSWMGGFSSALIQSGFGLKLPEAYLWFAIGFIVFLALLVLHSYSKRTAVFGLLWMAFALQPVLYFSNHSYPYYLAPALSGFSLVLASALSGSPESKKLRRHALSIALVCAFFWLSYVTVKAEGNWWNQRAADRQEFIGQLLTIDRKVPEGGTAYILGFQQSEFEKLENGGVFKAFNLSRHKFKFLLPELDPDLPDALHRLTAGGRMDGVYCFVYSAGQMVDRTELFRRDPFKLVPHSTVRFDEVPGVTIEVKPSIVIRGKDTFYLRIVNLNAAAVDLLYSIDGQIMPPLLQWRLDEKNSASVFADMTTPAGEYRFLAVRNSIAENAPWIRLDARLTVR